MDDAGVVEVLESLEYLVHDALDLRQGQFETVHQSCEIMFHVLEHQEIAALVVVQDARLAHHHFQQPDDVRVTHHGQDLYFPDGRDREPICDMFVGHLYLLEGHELVVLEVFGLIDSPVSACSYFGYEFVVLVHVGGAQETLACRHNSYYINI